MVRDSRSPRRSYHSDLPDSNARGSKSSRRDYDRDEKPPRSDDRRRNEDSSRRYGDSRDRRRDDRPQEEPRWGRRDEGDRRDRDRRDRDDRDMRDRERDRDGARDRVGDRDRDRRRDNREGSSRRSASPRRPSRVPSAGGSRSKSPEDKAKPNFGASGLLAAATKTVKHADGTGTVLKYHEPPEARKPSVGWRLYVFKGKEQVGEHTSFSRFLRKKGSHQRRTAPHTPTKRVPHRARPAGRRHNDRTPFLLKTARRCPMCVLLLVAPGGPD